MTLARPTMDHLHILGAARSDRLGLGGGDLLLASALLGLLLGLHLLLGVRLEHGRRLADVDVTEGGRDGLEEVGHKVLFKAGLGRLLLDELGEEGVREGFPVFFGRGVGGFELGQAVCCAQCTGVV